MCSLIFVLYDSFLILRSCLVECPFELWSGQKSLDIGVAFHGALFFGVKNTFHY